MDYTEALDFLNSAHRFGSKLGLERVRELCGRLGGPEAGGRYVHIAGTNGKGSTAAFVSSILRAAGYRTGCFISPYIQRFTERISVDGVEISEEEVVRHTVAIRAVIGDMLQGGGDHPTAFEIYMAMGFLHFAKEACDIVVLETGLGGALDATNIIGTKEAAVITNIGYDHMEQLGGTLEKIAGQKAGIITGPTEVVLYPMGSGSVLDVFRARARRLGARVHEVDADSIVPKGSFMEPSFDFGGMKDIRISLLGAHQYNNAATAITAAIALRLRGYDIPEAAIRRGLEDARWPGRMEILRGCDPMVLVDGAHNAQGALALLESLRAMGAGDVTFLVGLMQDKEAHKMIEAVAPLARRFLCVAPDNPRATPADKLRELTACYAQSEAFGSVAQAMEHAISTEENLVCCFGSLYMVGEIREILHRPWI